MSITTFILASILTVPQVIPHTTQEQPDTKLPVQELLEPKLKKACDNKEARKNWAVGVLTFSNGYGVVNYRHLIGNQYLAPNSTFFEAQDIGYLDVLCKPRVLRYIKPVPLTGA